MPWNGSHGCSGAATDIADINTVVAARIANGRRRPARNGSERQITHNTGTARTPATINCVRNRGNTESRNENVSRSMIRKSRNVSDSCKISDLKRDSAINSTTRLSASRSEEHTSEL